MNVYVNEQFPYLDFMDIRPGDRVVLKPNLVKEGKETDKNEWKCVVTSPELIRYVANYVCEKLGGKGEVYICDAPQTDSSFEQIDKKIGLTKIASCIPYLAHRISNTISCSPNVYLLSNSLHASSELA